MRRVRWQRRGRRHVPWHPLALHAWLPRFLRTAYQPTGTKERLAFLAASLLPDVPTVVRRQDIGQLLKAVAASGRTALPNWPIEVMVAQKAGVDQVGIADTFAPRLLLMTSPGFVPAMLGPLSLAVIGSGREVVAEAATRNYANLFASVEPGMAEFALEAAIAGECTRAGISTVGGLRTTYEITPRGAAPVSRRVQKRVGSPSEEAIEIVVLPGPRWIQRNTTTGREIEILPPWRALANLPAKGLVFGSDYYDW